MKTKFLFLGVLLFGLLWTGCKKGDESATEEKPNLSLTVVTDYENEVVNVSWDQANNFTDFKGYALVRSIDSIPDSPTPPEFHSTLTIFFRDSIHLTSVADQGFPSCNEFYYKLYIDLGDRYIYSETVKVIHPLKGLRLEALYAELLPGTDYLFISTSDKLIKYNLKTATIEGELINPFVDAMKFKIRDAGNGYEIFMYPDGYTDLLIYVADPITMEITDNFLPPSSAGGSLFNNSNRAVGSLDCSPKGFVFIGTPQPDYGIISVRRSDWTILDHLDYRFGRRNVEVIDDQNTIFDAPAENSFATIAKYQYTDDGYFSSDTSVFLSNLTNQNGRAKFMAISDSIILPFGTTAALDYNLEMIDRNSFSGMDFHFFPSNSDYILGVTRFGDLWKIEKNDFDNITELPLSRGGMRPKNIIEYNDQLIVLSSYYSNGNTWFLVFEPITL